MIQQIWPEGDFLETFNLLACKTDRPASRVGQRDNLQVGLRWTGANGSFLGYAEAKR